MENEYHEYYKNIICESWICAIYIKYGNMNAIRKKRTSNYHFE